MRWHEPRIFSLKPSVPCGTDGGPLGSLPRSSFQRAPSRRGLINVGARSSFVNPPAPTSPSRHPTSPWERSYTEAGPPCQPPRGTFFGKIRRIPPIAARIQGANRSRAPSCPPRATRSHLPPFRHRQPAPARGCGPVRAPVPGRERGRTPERWRGNRGGGRAPPGPRGRSESLPAPPEGPPPAGGWTRRAGWEAPGSEG